MSAGINLLGAAAAQNALESFANQMTDDEAYVGTTAEYGAALEFGVAQINLEARPWLRPSLRQGLRPHVVAEVLDGVLTGEIDNKALQIALEVEKIARGNMGGHDPPAPPGEYPAQPTGNLAASIAAAAEENEMRAKSESDQFK